MDTHLDESDRPSEAEENAHSAPPETEDSTGVSDLASAKRPRDDDSSILGDESAGPEEGAEAMKKARGQDPLESAAAVAEDHTASRAAEPEEVEVGGVEDQNSANANGNGQEAEEINASTGETEFEEQDKGTEPASSQAGNDADAQVASEAHNSDAPTAAPTAYSYNTSSVCSCF